MAKWRITPGTQGNTMNSMIEADADRGIAQGYKITQDISNVLAETKKDREKEDYFGKSKNGFRKVATIPDVVAMEILRDHDLDVYAMDQMEPADKARLFAIIENHYLHLKSTNGRIG